MGKPFGNSPISGVLSCWFDEPTEETPSINIPTAHASVAHAAVAAPVAPVATLEKPSQPAQNARQTSRSLLDMIGAMNGQADLFAAPGDCSESAEAVPAAPRKVQKTAGKFSFREAVNKVFDSPESRSYQWLQQQGLAGEFSSMAVSLEQRWNTDGSYYAVRRTANGYTHTVMLKADGSCCGERITGPTGPLAQFTPNGVIVPSDDSNRFTRPAAARQSA
jgi:hypothetical protein